MSGKFVTQYLAQCNARRAEKDPTSTPATQEQVIEMVKADIVEIDDQLSKADELKLRKRKLISVLEHCGDISFKRSRSSPDIPDIDLDDDTEVARELRRNIVDLIGKYIALTNRELILKLGGRAHGQDQRVLRAVKFLGERGVIERDRTGEEIKLVAGDKFDKKNVP